MVVTDVLAQGPMATTQGAIDPGLSGPWSSDSDCEEELGDDIAVGHGVSFLHVTLLL